MEHVSSRIKHRPGNPMGLRDTLKWEISWVHVTHLPNWYTPCGSGLQEWDDFVTDQGSWPPSSIEIDLRPDRNSGEALAPIFLSYLNNYIGRLSWMLSQLNFLFIKVKLQRLLWRSSGLDPMLPMQGSRVWSLVKEPRFHTLHVVVQSHMPSSPQKPNKH